MANLPTFFWYDLETFGKEPKFDRIAQFAGVRTNIDLEIVDEPILMYCKLAPDFLPDPQSCLVTHITPQKVLKEGICENDFITKIFNEFSVPSTCVIGYNNINFDDEFIRYAFYRNLLDPYSREYKNGNSRLDLINIVRLTHALRPSGINWVEGEDGKPIFKLEELTKANNLSHENAHDALSDVYATIALAKLIKEKQPRLFEYFYNMRGEKQKEPLFNIYTKTPFIYASTIFAKEGRNFSIVSPVGLDTNRRKRYFCLDLTKDITPFLELPVEELKKRIFSKAEDLALEGIEKLYVVEVSINKSPIVAPLNVMRAEDAARLNIDLDFIKAQHQKLVNAPELVVKLISLFNDRGFAQNSYKASEDPDFALYSTTFFLDEDREKFNALRTMRPEEILSSNFRFIDSRANELVWRFVCRNYPNVLSSEELAKWRSFCAARLLSPPGRISDYNFFMRKVVEHLNDKNLKPEDKVVMLKLLQYGKKMGEKVLGIKPDEE